MVTGDRPWAQGRASQPHWAVEGASEKQNSPQRCLPLLCPQLSPGSEEDEAHEGCSRENLGRIQFSVGYNFQESTLTVKIMKAQELPAKDFSGTSDPFVKIYLLPDKKHKLETKVKRKNLNPHWNETFLFEGEAVPPPPPESPLPLGCPAHHPATHTHIDDHMHKHTCTDTHTEAQELGPVTLVRFMSGWDEVTGLSGASIAARGQGGKLGHCPDTGPILSMREGGVATTGSRGGAPAVATVEGVRAQAVAQAA